MAEADPAQTFAGRILLRLLDDGQIRTDWRCLAVCGGVFDDRLLSRVGLADRLVTSVAPELPGVERYQEADAQALPFADGSFDLVLVHAGLHHCSSPHRALSEMYRVARRAVIAFEAQDSGIVRLLARLGLVLDYEFDAVNRNLDRGGVDDRPIPNYVYRWTRREVEKTVRSLAAERDPRIEFFSEFEFFDCFLEEDLFLGKQRWARWLGSRNVGRLAALAVAALNLTLPGRGNSFAWFIAKEKSPLQPWIKDSGGRLGYDFSR